MRVGSDIVRENQRRHPRETIFYSDDIAHTHTFPAASTTDDDERASIEYPAQVFFTLYFEIERLSKKKKTTANVTGPLQLSRDAFFVPLANRSSLERLSAR